MTGVEWSRGDSEVGVARVEAHCVRGCGGCCREAVLFTNTIVEEASFVEISITVVS